MLMLVVLPPAVEQLLRPRLHQRLPRVLLLRVLHLLQVPVPLFGEVVHSRLPRHLPLRPPHRRRPQPPVQRLRERVRHNSHRTWFR